MNSVFGTTAAIQEAEYSAKKRSFLKVTLIFILVYVIGTMVSSSILTVPMYGYMINELSQNTELFDALSAGDMNAYMEAYTEFTKEMTANMPDWLLAMALFATVGLTATVIFYCTKLERRRLFTLGFTKKGAFIEYAVGLIIGLIMFGLVYAIMIFSGHSQFMGINPNMSIGIIVLFFIGYILQGMSEEVLMRGYFFVSASYSSHNVALAVFLSSLFFALLHVSNSGVSPLGILNIFLFGVFAALYFLRRGNIWGIAAIHTIWNFAQGNVFGCSVSGNASGNSIFLTESTYSGTLINGGAFGPEGGIAVSIVLLIGIVILLIMKNKEVIPEYNMDFQSA